MEPPPLVTVVIPTYDDDPDHLAAALASAGLQVLVMTGMLGRLPLEDA